MTRVGAIALLALVCLGMPAAAQYYGGQGDNRGRQQSYAQHYVGTWGYAEPGGSSYQLKNDGLEVEGRLVQASQTLQRAGIALGTVTFRGRISERTIDGQLLQSLADAAALQRVRQNCNVAAYWTPMRATLGLDHRSMEITYLPFVLVRDGGACRVYNPMRDRERYQYWINQGQNSWLAYRAQPATFHLVRRQ